MRLAPEDDHESHGKQRQNEDAVGERQPVAAAAHLPGHVAVSRHYRGKARKILV